MEIALFLMPIIIMTIAAAVVLGRMPPDRPTPQQLKFENMLNDIDQVRSSIEVQSKMVDSVCRSIDRSMMERSALRRSLQEMAARQNAPSSHRLQ